MIRRSEYRPPDYRLEHIALDVQIDSLTTVDATLHLVRGEGVTAGTPLRLDGREMELLGLELDGHALPLSAYAVEPEALVVFDVPERFALRVRTRIDPESNHALEGWYRSGPMLCTQCEARGFSRITYAPDRPDVLARYRVRLEADRARYPVLLANGNCVETGSAGEQRHYAVWEDPHPKPCYLFAMVAGDLACVEGEHVTPSGRRVALRFYVDHGNEDRVAHALQALRDAMRWDEQVYGLEYDLDVYMVVAARDFNMGAMENKGLNLFNARYVLASPQTATDEDYDGVESVIAHEYFHNWTGNRVTCRDWFQLSLKEGLTVFRDQCFSADLHSPDVTRIEQVRVLRALQFTEDAGPTAHPVRPEAYAEVNNLYTATVYEKGAEILRMLREVIGAKAFVDGVRLYLERHDGQAATVEDLLAALEHTGGRSLDGFRCWYAQSGTPQVQVRGHYDAAARTYELDLRQLTPPTADQVDKTPLPIPVRFSLRDAQGRALHARSDAPELLRPDLILLDGAQARVRFTEVASAPRPGFLLGFSAPVKLHYDYSAEELAQLLLHEDDGFLRWEASRRLVLNALFEHLLGDSAQSCRVLLETFQTLAAHPPDDKALLAELLRLPSESELAAQIEPLDPPGVAAARESLAQAIAHALTGPLSVWAQWAPTERSAEARARRALSNLALGYLGTLDSPRIRALALERSASANMSLAVGALRALRDRESPERDAAMAAFHARFRSDALVLDKWFALEAGSTRRGARARVEALLAHPDFQPNPNRVRAVLGTFMRENLSGFHDAQGEGYALLARQIAAYDRANPQLAARLVEGLLGFERLAPPYARAMRAAVQRLADGAPSRDLAEKIGKALARPVTGA